MTMWGGLREGPTLKRGSEILMANSVSCVQDACCSFLCATRRVLLLLLCASHFSQCCPLALPNQRLLYKLQHFFFLFLPFLLYAPCQIHGRAAPHHFAFLPLSSSDPNVRVRKHIHFSDPQRRVPSSRFEASRQKQIETRDGHRHSQDFFSLANKTQHHKHTLLKCAFAAAGDIIQVLPE